MLGEVFSSSAHRAEPQRNQAGVTQYMFYPGHSRAHQRRPTNSVQRDNGRWELKSQTPVITVLTPSTLRHWEQLSVLPRRHTRRRDTL